MNFEGRNIILMDTVAFLTLTMPLIGGALYVAGSLVYWPTFYGLNPNDGGILFIAGSVVLFIGDISTCIIQPQFGFHKPLDNAGSFKNCIIMLGNIVYIVGSVYFLQALPLIVGCDLFIVSSLFQLIGVIIAIWGVISLNPFTAPYYAKFIMYKRSVIWINIFLLIGCIGFLLGSFWFINFNSEAQQLQQIGVIQYTVGSFGYVFGSFVGFKLKKTRLIDPLADYHNKIYSTFLNDKKKPQNLVPLLHVATQTKPYKKKQTILVNIEPSIQNQTSIQQKTTQIHT